MTCSAARLAANRQNAAKSTGPRSAEGKAASRLNGFRHGLAGAGDLTAPGEDVAAIDRLAASFVAELDARGEVGRRLARRAALLMTRMERAADRDLVVVAAAAEAARLQFDQDQSDELAEAIATLDRPAEALGALATLAGLPAGIDHLLGAWSDLHAAITAGDEPARARTHAWLGLDAPAPDLLDRVATELARLRRARAAMGSQVDAIARARAEAGLLAEFDPAPEATLARRYEAAAERGIYRAIRAIKELNRPHALDLPTPDAPFVPPPPAPAPPRPNHPPAPPSPAPADPRLGSFRLGSCTESIIPAMAARAIVPPPAPPSEPRQPRPDLRKLARKRR